MRISIHEKQDFYNKIAFYNYVQYSVGENSKCPPTKDMWERSRASFDEVLKMLNPDIMICMGKRLWEDGLPDDDYTYLKHLESNNQAYLGYYLKNNHKIYSYGITHPSAYGANGFNPKEWNTVHKEVVRIIKSKK